MEAIAASGLSDRCRIVVSDYRDLPAGEIFDKVASVGMFEHVGRAKLPAYFAQAFRLIRPGGLFLNHGIVDIEPPIPRGPAGWGVRFVWRPGTFIARYIFPGGELVRPAEAIAAAESAGFETRDVESLREHYALTLREWLRRLEARHEEAAALVGEPTFRTWRLYLAGCARGFAAGRLGLIQGLFVKTDGGLAQLPLSRADLYADPGGGEPHARRGQAVAPPLGTAPRQTSTGHCAPRTTLSATLPRTRRRTPPRPCVASATSPT
jgi:cyclopropane-fatty-acyl-phospholipid synthase